MCLADMQKEALLQMVSIRRGNKYACLKAGKEKKSSLLAGKEFYQFTNLKMWTNTHWGSLGLRGGIKDVATLIIG